MADPLTPRKRKLLERMKAVKIAEVLKETGKINLREAHRRMYPNASELTHATNSDDMLKGNVMDELEKILKIRDQDLMKKLTPDVIVQDLLADLMILTELMEKNKTNVEDVVKILNAKAPKQKLIGMAIGMWKDAKPAEREETASELMGALRKLEISSER